MKNTFLLSIAVALLFTSCSTAYKTGQTPDDVYYSPTKEVKDEVKKDEEEKQDKYEDYASAEDRYLRMKVRNRSRWESIDDYDYWYSNHYPYNYDYVRANWYNWYMWNTYTNPFISVGYSNHCCCYTAYNNIKTTPYITVPHTTRPNLSSYSNTSYSNTNVSNGNPIKKIFSTDGSRYSNRNSSSGSSSSGSRSYSSGSSSSSSGSSGGGISRPGKH